MTPHTICRSAAFCAVLALCLAGCSRLEASPGPARGALPSYELVTVERPESVAEYHKLYRGTYEMCAATRKLLKRSPPAPMLQPPADFITERKTYASDGKAFLTIGEYFTYHVEMVEPTFTCRTYLEKTSNSQLVRGGKVYDAAIDPDGKRESQPPEEWILPWENKTDVYTEPATVKGFAVKCMKMLPNTEKLITQLCIADLNPGTLTGPTGEPIPVASRVTIVQDLASTMRLEPVTLRVGHVVNQALFDAAAAP
jgi:hypothetical protein